MVIPESAKRLYPDSGYDGGLFPRVRRSATLMPKLEVPVVNGKQKEYNYSGSK